MDIPELTGQLGQCPGLLATSGRQNILFYSPPAPQPGKPDFFFFFYLQGWFLFLILTINNGNYTDGKSVTSFICQFFLSLILSFVGAQGIPCKKWQGNSFSSAAGLGNYIIGRTCFDSMIIIIHLLIIRNMPHYHHNKSTSFLGVWQIPSCTSFVEKISSVS